jgi:hypothetical protein
MDLNKKINLLFSTITILVLVLLVVLAYLLALFAPV